MGALAVLCACHRRGGAGRVSDSTASLGKIGTLLMALLFIVIGGASAGGTGVSLLPSYWQTIGAVFPPRHAVELYRNVRYFDGHNIVTPIAVLGAYALIGAAVIVVAQRRRKAEQPAAAAGATEAVSSTRSHGLVPKNLIAPIALAVLLTTIFAVQLHELRSRADRDRHALRGRRIVTVAGRCAGPPLLTRRHQYANEAAATQAMNEGEIYGALIAGDSSGSANQLTVVSSISDLSPLDIAGNFEEAAKKNGETVTVKPYAPTPLAPNDPFALVCSLVLVPLLVGGYMATTLLTSKRLGAASGRWHGRLAPRIRRGDRSGHRPHRHLLAQRAPLRLVLDRLADHGSHHPECRPARRRAATSRWSPRDLPHRDRGHPVRQPLIGRSERGPLPTLVLERPRPIPAAPQRLSAPAKHGLLRRTRHRPATQVLLAYAVIAAALLVVFDWFIDRPLSVPGIRSRGPTVRSSWRRSARRPSPAQMLDTSGSIVIPRAVDVP